MRDASECTFAVPLYMATPIWDTHVRASPMTCFRDFSDTSDTR